MLGGYLTLDTNNVYRLNLIVDLKEDEVEIPVIAREHFESYIYNKLMFNHYSNVEKIILPLYANSGNQNRKTFDTIVCQFFSTNYIRRLQKITTGKGDVYYGGKGVILDGDFNPLLLCTLLAKIVPAQKKAVHYRPICYIHPKVFEDTTKLINKGIINKIIPFYTSRNIIGPLSRAAFQTYYDDTKVKVIVDKFDSFFTKPVEPTPSSCSNELLNECLVDNIEDIMIMT
jgi:hypothetical protein